MSPVEGQASQGWAGLGWAGRMVGGKVQTEVHQGKRSRERHGPEQSHGKGGLGSCTEPRVPDGHTVPPPIGALGVVRSLAVLVASKALEGSRVSPCGSLQVSSNGVRKGQGEKPGQAAAGSTLRCPGNRSQGSSSSGHASRRGGCPDP